MYLAAMLLPVTCHADVVQLKWAMLLCTLPAVQGDGDTGTEILEALTDCWDRGLMADNSMKNPCDICGFVAA